MNNLTKEMPFDPVSQATLSVWAFGMGSFGNDWNYRYGDVDGPTFQIWKRKLRFFEPSLTVKWGEYIISHWDRPKPPTLGEFLRELRVQANRSQQPARPALPPPVGRSPVAMQELRKMYAPWNEDPPSREEVLARREARKTKE